MSIQFSKGLRVLVVDDEEMIRRVLSDILTSCGLEVVVAASGEEALGLFDAGGFALTITDRNMPGMGGGELARRLKEMAPMHPVLMVSGMLSQGEEGKLSDAGSVDGFLTKPFSRLLVLHAVGEALGWVSGS